MNIKTLIAAIVAAVVLGVLIWFWVSASGRADDLSVQLANAQKAAESEISRLTSQADQLQKNLDSANTKNKAMEKDAAANTGRIRDLESSLQTAERQLTQAQAENESLRTATAPLTAENEKLKTENEALKTENAALKAEAETLKSESASLKTATVPLQAESEALKAETEKLRAEAEQLKTEVGVVQKELTDKQAASDQNLKLAEARRLAVEKEAAALQRYIESNINKTSQTCPPCAAAPAPAAPAGQPAAPAQP